MQRNTTAQDPNEGAVVTLVDGYPEGLQIVAGHRPILASHRGTSQSRPNRCPSAGGMGAAGLVVRGRSAFTF